LTVTMSLGIGHASFSIPPIARQLRRSKSYALGSTVILPTIQRLAHIPIALPWVAKWHI
jgi:hypothetical protein